MLDLRLAWSETSESKTKQTRRDGNIRSTDESAAGSATDYGHAGQGWHKQGTAQQCQSTRDASLSPGGQCWQPTRCNWGATGAMGNLFTDD